MEVSTEGASGPQGNAAEGKGDALDRALNAALGGSESNSDDFPPQVIKAKMEAESADAKSKDSAGDKSGSEDARAPGDKAEAPTGEAAPSGDATPAREAPKHWPEERRKAFAAWPKEVQDHALAVDKDLQAGFTRKSQELSDTAKFAERVRGLFDDTARQHMARAGVDEVRAIEYLVGMERFSRQDPVGYIAQAMQTLGVTPEHLGFSTRQPAQQQPQPKQPPPSTGDPALDKLLAADADAVANLRSEFGQFSQPVVTAIQQLQARLDAQDQERQHYSRQQQVEAVQSIQKVWQDFRSSQDDHGQLAYPHADALMQPMGALMETHPVLKGMPDGPKKLAKAYAMALNADPELSKPIFEAEVSRRLAEQQKKAEAEKAKKAATVRPATGAPTMPAKKGGLDAALDAAFAKVGAR